MTKLTKRNLEFMTALANGVTPKHVNRMGGAYRRMITKLGEMGMLIERTNRFNGGTYYVNELTSKGYDAVLINMHRLGRPQKIIAGVKKARDTQNAAEVQQEKDEQARLEAMEKEAAERTKLIKRTKVEKFRGMSHPTPDSTDEEILAYIETIHELEWKTEL